ncbi:hypothetical protein DEV91_108190 [Phyllobacterium brassicacearum]|nr:hypothetical protein DEV91_108190 [Phyllobacterium brassicacearum]
MRFAPLPVLTDLKVCCAPVLENRTICRIRMNFHKASWRFDINP